MAAIDFPASPTNGQLFSAANGVTYRYDGTLWLVQAGPGGGTGDFYAINTTGSVAVPTTATTFNFNTVVTGNSGGWFVPSGTYRYTPPAGRYRIAAGMVFLYSTAVALMTLTIRKNGSVIASTNDVPLSGGWVPTDVEAIVDANGADWFDVQILANIAGAVVAAGANGNNWFSAFPLTGMQGPAGVISNGYRLINRIVPTAGQATVDFTSLPSDINDLQFTFDLMPQTTPVSLYLQFFDSTGTIVATGYYGSFVMSSSSSSLGGAPFIYPISNVTVIPLHYNATLQQITNSAGIKGSGRMTNIRDAARYKHVDFQSSYLADGGAYSSVSGAAQRAFNGLITGLRFYFSTGNFAAGGAVSVWGSP